MHTENTLAIAGIAAVLLGTVMTLYGIFAAPGWLAFAANEAGHRDAPIRAAIWEKYSRSTPPYTHEEVRLAQRNAELKLAESFMEVAQLVDAERAVAVRRTQRWAATGIVLITSGSILQALALLISS